MRILLPGKTHFLPLLFLSYLHMAQGGNCSESPKQEQFLNSSNPLVPCDSGTNISSTVSGGGSESPKAHRPFLVIQTPAALKVLEGSTVRMECSVQGMKNSSIWYIQWSKNGTRDALTKINRISINTSEEERHSLLILNKAEVADSGIYTCTFNSIRGVFPSNGTQLTIDGITDLMVNQTPKYIEEREGTNVTMECRFRTVSNLSSMDVRWYRNGTELKSAGNSLRIELDLERGFTSLTLANASASDSGNYGCQVESRSRNLTGSGEASSVVITIDQNTDLEDHDKQQSGTSLAIVGAGAGAGIAIFLLLVAGVIMWKRRSKVSKSESETSPDKEIGLHPPLINQPSDVTYADLHFHKREVRPDAEVVYAEVRASPRQQACKDAKMRHLGNRMR